MSRTKEDTLFGFPLGKYTSEDEVGRKGHGSSASEARNALARAQEKDVQYAVGGSNKFYLLPDFLRDGPKRKRK